MANQKTKDIDQIIASRRALLLGGGAALAAMAMPQAASAATTVTTFNDFDILNFALNLEYLEANFYYMAAFGCTIDKPNAAAIAAGAPSGGIPIASSGGTAGVAPTLGTASIVPFALAPVKAYAIETAIEEGKHVLFLQSAIKSFGGSSVAQPALDISPTNFTAVANLAGITGTFNPYSNDTSFLAGAYIFEDVGVTAYLGGAPLVSQTTTGKQVLQAALQIHDVEAYHAGLIRGTIYFADPQNSAGILTITQKVSQLRTNAANAAKPSTTPAGVIIGFPDDFGLYPGTYPQSGSTAVPTTGTVMLASAGAVTASNIADANPSTVTCYGRTPGMVINIVTGGNLTGTSTGPSKGAFYPQGLNGTFN